MIDKVLAIVHLLGQWSYLIIFLAAFLEGAAFMGFLVPGETVVVLSGFLASRGYLKLGDCILIISLGAVLGDTTGYIIGKVAGRNYFVRHKRFLFLKEKHIKSTEEYFRRHGGKTVFIGRFMSVLREMVPFTAGVSEMPFQRFLIHEVAGGISWALAYTLLGYFFGQSWQLIGTWAGRAGLFVFLIFLFAAALSYLYRRIVKKQEEFAEWFRDKYGKIVSIPFVRLFMRRHHNFIAFLKEKFSPEGYLVIHLFIGLIFSVAFAWMSAGLTRRILGSDVFVAADLWILGHILYFRTSAVSRFMIVLVGLGSVEVIAIGSIVIALYFLYRKRLASLATYLTAIVGGIILVFILRTTTYGMGRVSEVAFLTVDGWILPGGHGMMSVVYYGIMSYFIIRSIKSWKLRVFTILSAVFVVLLIGMSEIYLSVHYPRDLPAAYAGGLFWLTICITGHEIYKKIYERY
jgi:membrane protein DedA with SNARE-associated domain